MKKEQTNITGNVINLLPKNKRGLLGRLISGFIVIFIGVSLIGTISQEVDNAFNCNQTVNNSIIISSYEQPLGSTDSFGGGGSGHFGGYDGTVKKSWSSNLAPLKTNSSLINPNCVELPKSAKILLEILPLFFLITVIAVAITQAVYNLGDAGMI